MKPADYVLPGWTFVSMFMIAVTVPPSRADTLTINGVADAEIREFNPDRNFGAGATVVSGGLGSTVGNETRRALLKFDLSGKIPPQATIDSITLTIAVTRVPSNAANSTFELRRLLQDWSENGVTWNSRQTSETLWNMPGATGTTDSLATESSSAFVSGLGSYIFPSTPTFISDVQAMINNPNTNFGWLLISRSESMLRSARHFASRESGASAPTLVVNFTGQPSPMAITSASSMPSATAGSPYSFTMSVANGIAPYSWSITAGALPAGLALSSAGLLSGTPTNAGDFNFTVQVMDSASATATKAFTVTVNLPPLMIASGSPLPAGTVGVAYSQTLTASGGQPPYDWSVSAGILTGGLTLSGAGVLSGTPTNAGTFNFTAQVLDNAGSSTNKTFSLDINPMPLTIDSPSPLPVGRVDVPYSQNLSASGGTPPYNWSIAAGTLSGGLTLSSAGLLSGTPTNAGDFNFTVQVIDGARATTTKAFTVRVNPPALIIASGSTLPAGTVGVAYSQTLTASGGQPPYDWSVSAGILTGGLTLSGAGVLSGTPTNAGTFNFTAQVLDNAGSSTNKAFSLDINPMPLTIDSPSPLSVGRVDVPYSQNLSASGGTPPYNWSITAGTLSGGLTLSGAGLLSGTPTNAGDFNFTVQVMDSASATATKAFTVRVNPPALIIASGSPLPAGTVGVAYSQTLTASGGQPPYDWSVSAGILTGGLTLSGAGVLSGTPTNAGTFNFTAQVLDNTGSSTNRAFTLDINPPLRIDQVGLNSNQIRLQFTAQPGQPYALEFRASLATGDWAALTNIEAQPITVDVTFTDSITENGRFYRLKSP